MMVANSGTCINHPERAAVERCEVCHSPLCAYCLYYTSDGQRLCKAHAEQAAASGAFIRAPGVYADGLVASQIEANRDQPLLHSINTPYRGNATDLLALIGLLMGIISLAMCIPGAVCLAGPIALITSILALMGAKDAFDPARTRSLAGIGLVLSLLWVVVIVGCLSVYWQGLNSVFTNANANGLFRLTVVAPGSFNPNGSITLTSTPVPSDTPALTGR